MENSESSHKFEDLPKIFVLRWGHRPQRDVRLTTHVALTARALCAAGFVLTDTQDPHTRSRIQITKAGAGTSI
jgi:tRNA (cytidine56-2'-O)-methyltransferase